MCVSALRRRVESASLYDEDRPHTAGATADDASSAVFRLYRTWLDVRRRFLDFLCFPVLHAIRRGNEARGGDVAGDESKPRRRVLPRVTSEPRLELASANPTLAQTSF